MKEIIKQFLRPDWRKIVIFFVIMICWIIFFSRGEGYPPLADVMIDYIGYPVFLITRQGGEPGAFYGPIYEWNFINLIINIVIWYLISCLIIFVYNKLRGKKV